MTENEMTENKKLRTLLALARYEIDALSLGPRIPIVERIDAALAEPVSDPVQAWKDANGYDDLLAAYSLVNTERDEARAEIERLKLRFNAQWEECHDGSESACCKVHE